MSDAVSPPPVSEEVSSSSGFQISVAPPDEATSTHDENAAHDVNNAAAAVTVTVEPQHSPTSTSTVNSEMYDGTPLSPTAQGQPEHLAVVRDVQRERRRSLTASGWADGWVDVQERVGHDARECTHAAT